MAETSITTAATLAKKIWEVRLFKANIATSFFGPLMGKKDDPNAFVYVKSDFTKQQGESIVFGLRTEMSGDGVTSGQALENNEEDLSFYDFTITLEEYAHAVLLDGPLTSQRVAFNMDMQAKSAITEWGATKIDKNCFSALESSPTTIFYNTGSSILKTDTVATATLAVEATGKLTPRMVSIIKAWALTGGNDSQPALRPVYIDGREHYMLLVHPDVAFDFRDSAVWQQAVREAEVRGRTNPIFTGADAIWDDVIIKRHRRVNLSSGWGASANVYGSKCHFMGAQALCHAWGTMPHLVPGEKDWKRKHGWSWQMVCKTAKPVFNSLDYGSIGVYVARTRISDIATS